MPALDLVDDLVDEVAGGLLAGEVQHPALRRHLAADVKLAPDAGEAAGAALAARGRVGPGGPLGLEEVGQDQLPLRLGRGAGGRLEGLAHDLGEAGLDGAGEAREAVLAEALGGGEAAVELLDHPGGGAQAGALLPRGAHVEPVHRRIEGVEDALAPGGDGDVAPLPGREVGADGVLLDHLHELAGERGARADEGGDGGAGLFGHALADLVGMEPGEGVVAAVARDQAIAGRGGVGGVCVGGVCVDGVCVDGGRLGRARGRLEREDLDRHAQAAGADRVDQLVHRGAVEAGAVAGQGVRVDLGEGDAVDGVGAFGGVGHGGLLGGRWVGAQGCG